MMRHAGYHARHMWSVGIGRVVWVMWPKTSQNRVAVMWMVASVREAEGETPLESGQSGARGRRVAAP